MELAFLDKKIRLICEDGDEASAILGPAVAKALQNRLADLDAASNVTDLLVGNAMEHGEGVEAYYSLDIENGYLLFFRPSHTRIHTIKNCINWKRVTKIQILKLEKK